MGDQRLKRSCLPNTSPFWSLLWPKSPNCSWLQSMPCKWAAMLRLFPRDSCFVPLSTFMRWTSLMNMLSYFGRRTLMNLILAKEKLCFRYSSCLFTFFSCLFTFLAICLYYQLFVYLFCQNCTCFKIVLISGQFMVNLAWRSRIGRRGRIGRGRIKISIHYNTFRKWKKTQTQWNLHPNYILLLLQKEEEVLSSKLKKRILKINCFEFVLWFALFCVQSCLNLKYVCVTQKKNLYARNKKNDFPW